MTNHPLGRLATGVRNLDDLLSGGLPRCSVTVIAGSPGTGKTILTQQICFHNASAERRVLYFNTLSEPSAKTLRYLSQFTFLDRAKLDAGGIQFVDLGVILRTQGLEESAKLIMEQVKKAKPDIVVIDSFKVFDDLATSKGQLRKFGYELAVNLMAWETTTFLLGEFAPQDIATNPLFSIVDGLIFMSQRQESGEQQRFLQIVKMRGTHHHREEHSFAITSAGVMVFAPRVTIQRLDRGDGTARCMTGISKLDDLLGAGIPRGSSLLIAGVAGTGKTVLLLEFLYRGALAGEKGIIFSFEETPERLRAAAHGLGWDLDHEIERGMIEIVFIPQPSVMVEEHLLMIQQRVVAMAARRVAIDSISVFLHRIKDPQIGREKVFQLASIVQTNDAVGFFATDIPYGTNQLSRFGVEETVVDGVILLSSTEEALERQRYIEVYKLRNTAHLKGRHSMVIGAGGISIFPRYATETIFEPPPALETTHRLASGVAGLDELCGGGLLERSVTLVSGSAGIGKSTIALQFLVEGVARGEPGLYLTLEEGPAQILASAKGLGLPLERATETGMAEVVYLPRDRTRVSQFLTILDDKIRSQKTRRLVLDSVSEIVKTAAVPEDLRQLLHALVVRFKSFGVTSLFTLESESMYSTDAITERGYSPIADNIVMLRYVKVPGGVRSTISVVKTRGSPHDWGTYYFSIGAGGVRVGERVDGEDAPPDEHAPPGERTRG
jgi:circadian clock protein KaiC